MKTLCKEKLKENIEKIAKYDIDNGNVFGASYLVWQGGETVFKKHFGSASLDGSKALSDDTMFRLASMTKPITVVAIMILAERGLISLDDKIEKYLPEFKNIHIITKNGEDLGEVKTPPTIFHCLSHSSGFGSEKEIKLSDEDCVNMSATIKRYVREGLDFEPFSKSCYSAWAAFDVLGAIAEMVTGESFDKFLKREIFEPCNMIDTTFEPSDEQWGRIIQMHGKTDGKCGSGITYDGCVFEKFPPKHHLPGAGLVSTLNDYSNFAKMLICGGEFEGKTLLRKETFEKIKTPYIPSYTYESWGLGVRVITDEGYKNLPVGTFGWSGAYGTHFWVDTENELYAILLKNSRFDGGSGTLSGKRFEEAVFNSLI